MDNINREIDNLLNSARHGKEEYLSSIEKLNELGGSFNNPNPKFVWSVLYNDGTSLDQIEENKTNHFGNIKLDQIKTVIYESLDGGSKILLDWKTGKFSFNRVHANFDIEEFNKKAIKDNKKLILFTRKRFSQTEDGPFFYYRYILGYELNGKKHGVMINPNKTIERFIR